MASYKLSYKQYGAFSILIEWPSEINEAFLSDLLLFKKAIKNEIENELVYINSAYNSLLVRYKVLNNFEAKIEKLQSIYQQKGHNIKARKRLWKIPVCYDKKFGIDLDELSSLKGISTDELISLHSNSNYSVYFIGFLPGFLYLGGLPKILHTSRKASPRLKVLKGVVGIGGEQTGIYPIESPGGWNIIGNSPINFFNAKNVMPCFAQAGDKIKFCPITFKQHSDIATLINEGVYQLESEVLDD